LEIVIMNPPVPTNLKLLRGNPGKRAIRPEPEPEPLAALPKPPDFLTAAAVNEWWRISEELRRLRLLTVADLHPLAAYCQAFGRWVDAERALRRMAERDPLTHGLMVKGSLGNPIQNPLVKVAAHAARDMVRYAAEFGLTPAARTRIAAGAGGDDPPRGKFAGLLAS
jgi:P27 family predicted phage terminase small subunit